MEHKQVEKLWNKSFTLMLVLGVVLYTGFSMVTPNLSKYIVSSGGTKAQAGAIVGLMALTALVARPISGVIADRVNKKRLLIITTLLCGVSVLGYAMTTNLWVISGSRILHGIFFSISGTANMALTSLYIPKDRFSEGVGYIGLSYIISAAIGPGLGVMIGERYGYPALFAVAALFVMLSAVFMLKLNSNECEPLGTYSKIALKDLVAVEILGYAGLSGLFSVGAGLISGFIVLMAESRGIQNVALFFTVQSAASFIPRLFAGRLSDKMGLAFVMYPAYIMAGSALILLAFADTLWMILVAAVLFSFGEGIGRPSLQAYCLSKMGKERAGVATSTIYLGSDVGQGLGPTLGGKAADIYGYGNMYLGGSVLLGLGVIGIWLHQLADKRRAKPVVESTSIQL